jgi:hypothetical protein
MKENINPCPRCGSKMTISEGGGGMRDWPYVSLNCSKKDCMWNMRIGWDDLGGTGDRESSLKKLIQHWNEGTNNIQSKRE